MKEIQTVGRRRLVVHSEAGRVKIDIMWKDRRLATLDIEPDKAAELENALRAERRAARKVAK